MAISFLRSGIYPGVEKSIAFTTIDHTSAAPITAGQVLVVNTDGTVSPANAATDKTKRCLVATESFNLSNGNDVGQGLIELAYTHMEDRYAFKMLSKKSDVGFVAYTQADVGKICGLSADGLKIDKANTVELVEITKVSPATLEDLDQKVFFRFL